MTHHVNVVNLIPKSLSGETNQDSEPSIAVDPDDPDLIAATAFTPVPPTRLTMFRPTEARLGR